jgi:hypothetical protein
MQRENFQKLDCRVKGVRKIMGSPLMPESRVINQFHAKKYVAYLSRLAAKF